MQVQSKSLRYRGYYFDSLQSRYYDPELGRFLNADSFASTGQGILGNNMFAYCGNNPGNCLDAGGTAAKTAFSDNFDIFSTPWQNSGGGGGIYIRYTSKSSFALVEETTEGVSGTKIAQILGGNFDALSTDGNTFTLISFNASAVSIDIINGNTTFSLFDLGNASISAGMDGIIPFAEAFVSVWSPSVSFRIKSVDVTLTLHLGSVGGGFHLGKDGIKWGHAKGFGYSLDLSW